MRLFLTKTQSIFCKLNLHLYNAIESVSSLRDMLIKTHRFLIIWKYESCVQLCLKKIIRQNLTTLKKAMCLQDSLLFLPPASIPTHHPGF